MEYKTLITEAFDFIRNYIANHDISKLQFHNEIHIQEVSDAAQKIAEHYQLEEREFTIVLIAAYFHDTGYFDGGYPEHEIRGANLADSFLRGKESDEDFIKTVHNCILATRLPQNPKNLLEEIVCDADMFHFGIDSFKTRNKLMRKEAEAFGGKVNKNEWLKNTIKLLEKHQYHTDYCRNLLEQKKQQNIEWLKSKEVQATLTGNDESKENSFLVKDKRPERGIETMFRITSTNNQRLSDMADNKANILITVNSIILSITIALLLGKLDNNPHLIFPTAILLCASLTTTVIAILATRPSIPDGYHNVQEVKEKKVNLLFFGNFHKMKLEDYREGMLEMMEDRDYLYGTLIKDVFSQGVVLGKKFKLLRLAYNIFMYGLIVSVLTFLTIVLIYS